MAEDEVNEHKGVTSVGTCRLEGAGGSLGTSVFPSTLLEVPPLELAGTQVAFACPGTPSLAAPLYEHHKAERDNVSAPLPLPIS